MTYFIDFDHTIFDTATFKKMLREECSVKNLFRVREYRYLSMNSFATFFATGRLSFTPKELRTFLYPEVSAFLEAHGPETIIVTYGLRPFIMSKVTSALAGFPLKRVIYTSKKKGSILEKLRAQTPAPYIFIDDAVFQLESVAAHCSDIKLFEMRRDGAVGAGRWPVIHSLDELPDSVQG